MAWNQSKYEQAKAIIAEGSEDEETTKALQVRVAQYEEDRARGYNQAPREEGRAPQPTINVPRPAAETPKPGPGGYWKPNRPLGVTDYIPQDTGGSLAVWRDMPIEVYRRKIAAPQRQSAITAGAQAMAQLQRYGANAFAPEDQMKLTMLIAQGQAAAAQDLGKLDETDEGYQQFNEQRWQQAVQQRQQDPNAGPIQRLEKAKDITSFYYTEKAKDLALSGMRGALDMGTFGLGTGGLDALTEAASGREAVNVSRGLEEAHPLASGAGGAVMGILRPKLGTAGVISKVFGKAAPALGRYAGAALGGAAGGIVEGTGRDIGAEAADALSDDPSAALDQGRLDPTRFGINTAVRGTIGAAAGTLGQGIADLGRGLANKISESAIRGTAGRTPYEAAEAAGYKFDPVLGIRPPALAKQQGAITRETGQSWAGRYADKATPGVARNVDSFEIGEKAAMGKENLSYFNSVGNEVTAVSNLNRAMDEVSQELRRVNPGLVKRLRETVRTIDPLLTPRDMGKAIERVSNEADRAAAGSDSQAAEAYKRLQAGLMEDLQNLPKGNLPDGWPALRAQHETRAAGVEEARQLTGARKPGASLPDEVSELNRRLMNQGKQSVSTAQEAALDRFMPPDLKRETLMIRAANMVEEIGGDQVGPYPSRAGVLNWAGGKLVPRAYGLGRAVSRPPDNFPVSDKMFTFLNSRIPRATMFMPGMDLGKMVQERLALDSRPKSFKDLTPEQQQFLLNMASPQQEQGATP